MKIQLIAPADGKRAFLDWEDSLGIRFKKRMALPLSLPTLAAVTPSDVELQLIDEYVKPIDFNEEVDLVGISFMTYLAPRAYEIADEFRMRGVKVVLGGIHASMLPEEAIKHADAVCIGEAEELWPLIIEDFKKQKLKKQYVCLHQFDLKKSPIPRWDLIKSNFYNFHMLQVSRGCPYDCDFCCVKRFFGEGYRVKNVDHILKEIDMLKAQDSKKAFFFNDDNLLGNINFIKKLFKEIKKFNIRWFCQSSINLYKFPELVKLMYESGCRSVFIGFESVSQRSVNLMNKARVNKVDEYTDAIKVIQSHGISVFGSFILGSDGDDRAVFKNTVNFINDSNIVFSLINILTPPPKTRLYEKLAKEGRILEKDWSKYDGTHVCFKPLNMSVEHLKSGYDFILKNIYTYDSLLNRLLRSWESGLLLKKRNFFLDLISKEKISIIAKALLNANYDEKSFLLKSLFRKYSDKSIALSPLLMALSFHNFAFSDGNNRIIK